MAIKHFVTHQISKDIKDPAASLNTSEQDADLESEAVAHFYAQTASQLRCCRAGDPRLVATVREREACLACRHVRAA